MKFLKLHLEKKLGIFMLLLELILLEKLFNLLKKVIVTNFFMKIIIKLIYYNLLIYFMLNFFQDLINFGLMENLIIL
jgi:hypothetical protein